MSETRRVQMSDWPRYESHKIVQAAKIVGFHATEGIGRMSATVDPGDGGPVMQFIPTHRVMMEKAEVGDWAMLYKDGFRSISPAKAFEEGYRKVEGSDFPG